MALLAEIVEFHWMGREAPLMDTEMTVSLGRKKIYFLVSGDHKQSLQ